MLTLKDVSFSVTDETGTKDILKDINLNIEDNKFIAITGPNGGGKSTLAKLITGIEKPSCGKICFDGQDITELSVTDRAKLGISYGFQTPVKFKGLTVNDLIRLAASRDLTRKEACQYLSEVGLCAADYLDREVNDKLSGGELKRIEIATVLARESKFSIFDEPEAGIDLWSFQSLIQVFERIRENTQGTVLIISHQERILKIADEIIVLVDGRISKTGSSEEILPELLNTSSTVNPCEVLK